MSLSPRFKKYFIQQKKKKRKRFLHNKIAQYIYNTRHMGETHMSVSYMFSVVHMSYNFIVHRSLFRKKKEVLFNKINKNINK
jgi:hypothetical protein